VRGVIIYPKPNACAYELLCRDFVDPHVRNEWTVLSYLFCIIKALDIDDRARECAYDSFFQNYLKSYTHFVLVLYV
jgi:hypothetical protein